MDITGRLSGLASGGTTARFTEALMGERFVLYSQPIEPIDRDVDSPCQEIFVRFLDEEERLLPPGTFVPVLDDYRLMGTLDRWVVHRVLRWLRGRLDQGTASPPPPCSVNLSNDALTDPRFAPFVTQQLSASGVPPAFVLFEIAEPDARCLSVALERFAAELGTAGCGFVVTNYSGSLLPPGELRRLGIGFAKIDPAMSSGMHEQPHRLASTRAINDACHGAGVKTIGELIEKQDVLERFRDMGVDFVQGHWIGMPRPLP